jgi:GntR family transcriptional regulator
MLDAYRLDKSKGAAPLYHQLKQILKKEIEEESFVKGDIFPCEKDLMNIFEVSRTTVRQAIADLTNLGYLRGERGVGTIVTFSKINERLKSVISFSEEMRRHGIIMSTSHCKIDFEIASKYIAQQLGVTVGEKVIHLIRVRCADGAPLVYSNTYLPGNLDLPLEESNYDASLYEFLKKEKNILVTATNDTLEAILADEEIAKFLKIELNTAVFKRTRKGFDQFGKQVEFSLSYYPGDKYKYNIDL